jgi:hypothetical protein
VLEAHEQDRQGEDRGGDGAECEKGDRFGLFDKFSGAGHEPAMLATHRAVASPQPLATRKYFLTLPAGF